MNLSLFQCVKYLFFEKQILQSYKGEKKALILIFLKNNLCSVGLASFVHKACPGPLLSSLKLITLLYVYFPHQPNRLHLQGLLAS